MSKTLKRVSLGLIGFLFKSVEGLSTYLEDALLAGFGLDAFLLLYLAAAGITAGLSPKSISDI